MNFIEYCSEHKIILAVFPFHATHTLQSLNVRMYKPLSSAYPAELLNYLRRSHGIQLVEKGDFFESFWKVRSTDSKEETNQKPFEATRINPPNA
jgi:hypothetical protein